MMIDVDHFKVYNDLHGHQAGDACLREIARTLRRCIRRSGDIIARFGGEEFAVHPAETETDAVMLLAAMLEQRIREDTGTTVKPARHGQPGDGQHRRGGQAC